MQIEKATRAASFRDRRAAAAAQDRLRAILLP